MEKQIFIDGIETNYTVTDDGVVKIVRLDGL
jgi:hypothetical protein